MIAPLPKAAFELQGKMVPLARLLPTRGISENMKTSSKFRALLASVREVGIVEPLSVFPQKAGTYLILDGHVRVEALRELGQTEAPCLVANEVEGYTYNHKVNRISPIQANRMILKALDAGVSEDRIAKALNLTVSTVRSNRHLLLGICDEAVELLRDKQVSRETLALLKKVRPLRQLEMADIMVAAGNYSATYARALVVTTAKDQLVDPNDPKKAPGIKPEDLAKLEHEMRVLEKDFRVLDETYNEQVMGLTIARGYLRSLLENGRAVRHLAQNAPDFLKEFQRIVESNALEG
jgi:ParB-like chromosome segregation protein Spo0J